MSIALYYVNVNCDVFQIVIVMIVSDGFWRFFVLRLYMLCSVLVTFHTLSYMN